MANVQSINLINKQGPNTNHKDRVLTCKSFQPLFSAHLERKRRLQNIYNNYVCVIMLFGSG